MLSGQNSFKITSAMKEHNRAFLQAVAALIARVKLGAVCFNIDAVEDWRPLVRIFKTSKLLLFSRDRLLVEKLSAHHIYSMVIPGVGLTRRGEARAALTIALLKDWIKRSEKIAFISGSAQSKLLDTLMILRPKDELKILHAKSLKLLSGGIQPEVFETTLTLALELAQEGREGKPIGTMFVLGDTRNVLRLSHQMVLNPFKGYAAQAKNILDPALKESIREFATLDGAFVIGRGGVVLAAGRYISTPNFQKELPAGLGTRHQAAAAITQATKAIAITISESTGAVRAFRRGEIFLELEKAAE